MRWIIGTVSVLFLLWLGYMASPYLAIYDLARAVEARDQAAISERIDFAEVRRGLAGQIAQALRSKSGEGPFGNSGARAARAAIDPFLEPFVSPAAIVRLLGSGAPEGGGATGSGAAASLALKADTFASPGRLWEYFLASEFRGFRAFLAFIPPERPAAERFRIVMRLTSGSWRVVGIDLPTTIRDRLVENVRRGNIGGAIQSTQ